nr:Serine/threonine-protein kinase wnk3 [Polyrhizophydium stewartii]
MTSGTLKSYIRKTKGPVRVKVLRNWAKQILSGLHYLHTRDPPIIHRDLKSENIFINGNNGQAKIGDLGLAAVKRREHLSSVLGTPEFMAPELYDEKYDERVDIYAFGMVLIEIATKEYPYAECTNQAQIYKKVSTGVKPAALYKITDEETRKFIELCIESNPEKRPMAAELLKHPFIMSAAISSAPSVDSMLTDSASQLHTPSGSVLSLDLGSAGGPLISRQTSNPALSGGVAAGHQLFTQSPTSERQRLSGEVFTSMSGTGFPSASAFLAASGIIAASNTPVSLSASGSSTVQAPTSHPHQADPPLVAVQPAPVSIDPGVGRAAASSSSSSSATTIDTENHTFLVLERSSAAVPVQGPAICAVEAVSFKPPNIVQLKMTYRVGSTINDIKFPFNLDEDTSAAVVGEMVRESVIGAEHEQAALQSMDETIRRVAQLRSAAEGAPKNSDTATSVSTAASTATDLSLAAAFTAKTSHMLLSQQQPQLQPISRQVPIGSDGLQLPLAPRPVLMPSNPALAPSAASGLK